MSVLLLGKGGQLGSAFLRQWRRQFPIVALNRSDLDLMDAMAIKKTISSVRPKLVLNTAAYTNVDLAESEPNNAHAVNAEAPGVIAAECAAIGATLIHISTDYVFDGNSTNPYTELDLPNPLNVYGASKLEGEKAALNELADVIVLRASWIYSAWSQDSFIGKLKVWSETKTTLRVVDDQKSSPMSAASIAKILISLTEKLLSRPDMIHRVHGLYHFPSAGVCSRYEWAKEWLHVTRRNERVRVEPAKTEEFPTAAIRPKCSALDGSKFEQTFGLNMQDWRDALRIEVFDVDDRPTAVNR